MGFDVVILSRIQFALTIMFHYLFPPLTIGLGVLMVIFEGSYLKTGDRQYEVITRFWTRIFALNFALGVATGVVMEFQFGTNWAVYSRFVGDVFGSALAAEGVFAFFLESGFLAVVVFGWDRVSPRMHFFSTIMVALGSIFSSIWIVVANSWQQTPAGFHIVGEGVRARAEITEFWAMVFNPSSVHRLVHVWLGALMLGAFFVMSISAHYLLQHRFVEISKKTFSVALGLGLAAGVAIVVSGDIQAKKVAETQPAKLAAFEGHFHTTAGGTPLYVFGYPDSEKEKVRWGASVPGMLSLLVHGDTSTPVRGLDQFPRSDWPPVALSFLTYHAMVGLGFLMLALLLYAAWRWMRGTLFQSRWLLRAFVLAVVAPVAANEIGWAAAEVGRQPWIVYGLLRTSDAVSRSVSAGEVLGSIIMFAAIYLLLFAVWIFVLNDKIQHGPDEIPSSPHDTTAAGLLGAAAALANPSGPSLTGAREDGPQQPSGQS